jgi:hypothetical protein
MRKIGFVLLIAVSGFLGGVVSDVVLRGTPAAAQMEDAVADVVRAKRFEVVDDAGKPRASLSLDPDGRPFLGVLDDAEGSPVTHHSGEATLTCQNARTAATRSLS